MLDFWIWPRSADRSAAIVDISGADVSYGDLHEMAEGWSARLQKVAGGRRPIVALDFETSPPAIAAYLGALRAGLPVLLVEPGKIARETRLASVWRPEIHIAQDNGCGLVLATPKYEDATLRPDAHRDLALLLSTSGSTGDPKLVRLSQRNIASNAESIARYLSITPADRAMVTLPLFYSYGLSVLNSYLAAGATLILNERSVVDPLFREDFLRYGATSMALVPHQFHLLAGSGFGATDLPGLRYVTQAGGKLDAGSVRRFHDLGRAGGWDLVLMYGQTEAAPRISYVPPDALPDAADTIGVAVPGGRLRLFDESGKEIIAAGQPGELVYDGPNVMMGYAETRHDLAKDAEVRELRTGDIAERTADGFFRIVGRLKRFVKIAGLRLSLDRIETLLQERGITVQAVAAEDRLVLLCLTTADSEAARQMVANACGLPLSEVAVGPLEALPLLASGKPDHGALSRIATDVLQHERARRKAAGRDLAKVLRVATRARSVGPDDSFSSLGGDSLSYLQMQMALEEMLGSVPPGWERMPLVQLEALVPAEVERQPRGRVGIDVLLRVFALSFVVVQHATDYPTNGGVWVLIVLMGWSIARFQLGQIEEGRALRLGVRLLYPILPFYFLVLIAYDTLRGDVPLAYYALVGEYAITSQSLLTVYWFVSFYAKAVALLMLAAAVPSARRLVAAAPWAVAAATASLFLGAQVLLLLQGDYVVDQVSTWPAVHYTTHGFVECMPFFILGWMVQTMRGRRQTVLTGVLAAVTLGLFLQFQVGYLVVAVPAGSIVLLALDPDIRLPLRLARVLQTIAASTLFIYLLHQIVLTPLYGADLPQTLFAVIGLALSLGAGVAAKVAFDGVERAVSRRVAPGGSGADKASHPKKQQRQAV